MIVEFINVSRYTNQEKTKFSIKEASFYLKDQQSLAVLGKSVLGKSDLLKLISGSILPSSGKIIKGTASSSMYLGDTSTFHKELTGEETIRFLCKLYGRSAKEVITQVAELSGLGDTLKKRLKFYTPPQKRMIALSAPLFLDIKMYVIDGGIGHPDAQFLNRYKEIFTEKMLGKTLIIRCPDLPFLKKHTSAAVIVKDNGEVIFKDSLEKGLEEFKRTDVR